MTLDLTAIVQRYLDDEPTREQWTAIIAQRDSSIVRMRRIVEDFTQGTLDLVKFREAIDRALRNDPANDYDDWGARGTGFLMELNKLAKHHPQPITENELRRILSGLSAANVGERIDQWYGFLQNQKTSIKARNAAMNPGSTAFFLTLFAFWLDRTNAPTVCYPSLRQGLYTLITAGLVHAAPNLAIAESTITVRSASHYHALNQTLEALLTTAPTLKRPKWDGYWAEAFCWWIVEHASELFATDSKKIDPIESVEKAIVIDHAPLRAIPEAQLKVVLERLQQRLLIDETTLRRVYYGLLAGHVILTGPPGTGKTELARILPEMLWQSNEDAGSNTDPLGSPIGTQPTFSTAYTTTVVTATGEWSIRTLIGGLVPYTDELGSVKYRIQPGHLTRAILENWAVKFEGHSTWAKPSRVAVPAVSAIDRQEREFRGRWLVIDEFNRAPIDVAFGEALTALGSSGIALRVPVDGGTNSAELPLPQDFRIIGTLNSFDRTYLNRISEALKRRFTFIQIDPPSRAERDAEQKIVLNKVRASVTHLTTDGTKLESNAFTSAFQTGWSLFEILRIYRQLGTAQAISLFRHMAIPGLLQGFTRREQWLESLDHAFCDTIADQLQVLLPDELEVLILALQHNGKQDTFDAAYGEFFKQLSTSQRRRHAQLEALQHINPAITADNLNDHLAEIFQIERLAIQSHFIRRLRSLKAERGL